MTTEHVSLSNFHYDKNFALSLVNILENSASKVGLSFNAQKTEYMTITKKETANLF